MRRYVPLMFSAILSCEAGTMPLPGCTGPVTPTMVAGTSPRLEWTPKCGLQLITVRTEPSASQTCSTIVGSDNAWFVEQGENLIDPPVFYGIAPRGTITINPCTLDPGRSYTATFVSPSDPSHSAFLNWIQ
jgi:hypothetical protein